MIKFVFQPRASSPSEQEITRENVKEFLEMSRLQKIEIKIRSQISLEFFKFDNSFRFLIKILVHYKILEKQLFKTFSKLISL